MPAVFRLQTIGTAVPSIPDIMAIEVIYGSTSLYAGLFLSKKTLIALPLMLILALPISAFAESFTVTTNKDIYTPDEKAIIVGAIPEDAPEGYAVLINVTGPKGDCATENTLPAADNSFRSRPVTLDECGFGEFTVLVFYADQKASSRFTISNSSQADAGSKLELRTLKNVMLQALDVINARVKELIEGGYVLPGEVAGKYSEGVSEASLALQAIEFGDAAEAKKHMIFSLRDLRQVRNALTDENVANFEHANEEQATNGSNSDVVEAYNWLQGYYNRLVDLAEKNQMDENQFKDAELLLANTRGMIDEGNFEGAKQNLEQVNILLEAIRANLYDEGEGEDKEDEEKRASDTNGSQAYEEEVRKLTNIAANYKQDALELLNMTGSNSEAKLKVQEALSFIANAVADIDAEDLESARDALRAANKSINEARDLIEDDEDSDSEKNSDDDNSGKSSDDKDSGNSGSGDDDDKDKGSNKGNDDDNEEH